MVFLDSIRGFRSWDAHLSLNCARSPIADGGERRSDDVLCLTVSGFGISLECEKGFRISETFIPSYL